VPPAPKPDDEVERLTTLFSLDILDTEPSESIDRYTRMAKRIFHVSTALVTFIDDERQYVMSGFAAPCDLPRSTSFCGYAILGSDVMVVNDTTKDERFADSPFVGETPMVRFYAGAPITIGGRRVGTFCVFDDKPHEMTDDETELLKDLATSVESEFASARLAVVDELTGLYNRRGFQRAAEQLLHLADRNDEPITVFAFDIDDLKGVNDREGHAAGDLLITAAADELRATFRASDLIARVGGDEFHVFVYGACDAQAVVARLFEARSAGEPGSALSLGWASAEPGARREVGELLAAADLQMYVDKQSRKAGEATSAG
jgi:diguanylate cyclase (GGDEF)-like protein